MVKRIFTIAVLGVAGTFVGRVERTPGSSSAGGPCSPRGGPHRAAALPGGSPRGRPARCCIRPYVGPVYGLRSFTAPAIYGSPYVYGGGVSVVVGY